MFEGIDYSNSESVEDALHHILDPAREAGILSGDEWELVSAKAQRLMDVIRNYTGDGFWDVFQREFGFASTGLTPMNAANLCPEPTGLLEAANLLRLFYNNNVAAQTRTPGGYRVEQLKQARIAMAESLGVKDPEDVAIVRNASEANNAINCGYRQWTGKENVVLWTENHPTNLAAWHLRAGKGKLFEIREVNFNSDAGETDIAAAFTSKIDDETRFVSYSAISNGSGFRIPDAVIEKIWQSVQGKKCHVHVDGTMLWGASSVNLEKGTPFCHSFASSGHKWFLGPKETGILYMKRDCAKEFVPSIYAYDFKIDTYPWDKLPESALRFELIGQRDDVNIIILRLTQLMWTELVRYRRDPYGRVKQLSADLVKKLQGNDWPLITPADDRRRLGVVRVQLDKVLRKGTLDRYLYENRAHGIAGAGDLASFRLCPHIYNTTNDIDRAIRGMNEWRNSREDGLTASSH